MAHILEGPVHLDFTDKHAGVVFRRPELLLHPPIPHSLYTVNPRNIEGKAWWDEVRRKAYAENDYHCFACGAHQLDVEGRNMWLEAHECYDYDWINSEITFREVVALCPYCHKFIHFLGSLGKRHLKEVLIHGIGVLTEAGLEVPNAQHFMAKTLFPGALPDLPEVKSTFHKKFSHLTCTIWTLKYGGARYDWRAATCSTARTHK